MQNTHRVVAGGAIHIGDNPNGKRPQKYTRGELPRGRVVSDYSVWVGNTMHGYRGRVFIVQCDDGLWMSFPQPTGEKDWASYLLDGSEPIWVKERYQQFLSLQPKKATGTS